MSTNEDVLSFTIVLDLDGVTPAVFTAVDILIV